MKRLLLTTLLAAAVMAQNLQMTTSQYDNRRTGGNLLERKLTPETVNAREFGKTATLPVDGNVYAQPLYLSNVNVPGKGRRNLLFVVTEHNSVYAFDADTNGPEPLWHVTLNGSKDGSVSYPLPASDASCPFISPEVGITATPAIDIETGTLFVLSRNKMKAGFISPPTFSQQLHGLAITTGREKSGGPVEIRASVKGSGAGSKNGRIDFDSLKENPRAALLVTKGTVYATWGSSCDAGPYHGWVMAYDARTLRQLGVFNVSPDGGEGGIWQSDTGPAADDEGNVFVSTGNGSFNAGQPGGRDYGDSVVKLRLQSGNLIATDFFTPANQENLNATDADLGSGGPLLLPAQAGMKAGRLIFGGKEGVLYSVDSKKMGGFEMSNGRDDADGFVLSKGIYSTAAYWHGNLYTYASSDSLKQFAVRSGQLMREPLARSNERSRFSGGTPTVSANGDRDGVVWVVETRGWNEGGMQAVLRAYDARNVAKRLYASDESGGRDTPGAALRFLIPTVANGRVYVGGVKGVSVYGLLKH